MVAKNAFSSEVAETQKKEKSNVHKYCGKALALTLLLVILGFSANVPTFENAKNCENGVEKQVSGKNVRILFGHYGSASSFDSEESLEDLDTQSTTVGDDDAATFYSSYESLSPSEREKLLKEDNDDDDYGDDEYDFDFSECFSKEKFNKQNFKTLKDKFREAMKKPKYVFCAATSAVVLMNCPQVLFPIFVLLAIFASGLGIQSKFLNKYKKNETVV